MARILVIDDDPNNRLLLATLLRHAHHEVIEAANGLQGFDLARSKKPDLVVVDLSLPDVAGADLIKRFRTNPETAGLRLAVYSATHMPAAIEELVETFDIAGVIPKPAAPKEILTAFDRILSRM